MFYDELQKCASECQTGGECIADCVEVYEEAVKNCPCAENCICKLFLILKTYFSKSFWDDCPCGAFDCDLLLDPIAESCKDPSSNSNHQFCSNLADEKLINCNSKCEDEPCRNNCWTDYGIDLGNCPCGNNCPGMFFVKCIITRVPFSTLDFVTRAKIYNPSYSRRSPWLYFTNQTLILSGALYMFN